MKTRIVMGSLVATLMAFQGMAQGTENDDMYFNSKDRIKLKSENATASANDKIDSDYKAFKNQHFDESETVTETGNPTDSYSARTINPEYISRSNSEQASEDEQNYYVEGYAPNTYDSYSSGNYNTIDTANLSRNNLNYNNSWYGNASSYNSYSPYYGYCDPWMSPYYSGGSGWSFSLSYTWGNMQSPGWGYGMSYGWGNSYYNPYSYYSPYYPNYGYPNYYYGSSESSKLNYGKRPSRHSAIVTPTKRSSHPISSSTSGSTNGRTRQQADEYYVKPSRRTSTLESIVKEATRDGYSTQITKTRTRDSYDNTRDSRPTYSAPSRSSSGGSTPSRSSGSSSSSRSRKN